MNPEHRGEPFGSEDRLDKDHAQVYAPSALPLRSARTSFGRWETDSSTMLVNTLLETMDRGPSAPAVADEFRALSYRRLTRFAAVLRDVIHQETDRPRVGIMLPASTAFPGVLFGTLWADRVAVPLNFLLSPEELAAVVTDAELDLVLTIKALESRLGSIPVRVACLEDLPLRRRVIYAGLRSLPPVPSAEPDQTAVILYTSGTTAQPKGVELTHGNLSSNCHDTITSLNIDQDQRFLNLLPPFHVFGLTACVLVPVVLGASVFALPRFNPLAAVKAVAEEEITILMAIPSMYAAMLRTKSTRAETFAGVHLAISGGEPLPERVRLEFKERFGISLRQGYGLTETSPVVSACSREQFRDGSVGRPIRHVEVRIIGVGRRPCPVGADGHIQVRGPGVMKGYYRRPEESRAVLDDQGWFDTGDVGHLDADGFLFITGRAKEMLIVSGENVYPREIESVLEAHPDVLQVAVVGLRDGLRGEVPAAFVIPRKGADPDEGALRAFARQALAGYKVPRRIIIREDLPVGPTGKLLKRKLIEMLNDSHPGRGPSA